MIRGNLRKLVLSGIRLLLTVYFFNMIRVSSLVVIKYVVSWLFGAKYGLIHVRNNKANG